MPTDTTDGSIILTNAACLLYINAAAAVAAIILARPSGAARLFGFLVHFE